MNSAIDFTNKTFVVAGAGGIGAATAKTLNAYGARILLLDLNENNLNRTLLELKGEGNKTYICDFSAIHTIEPCVNSIIEENGPVDGLVFCVGVGVVRPLKLSKYEFMLKVMNVNFFHS